MKGGGGSEASFYYFCSCFSVRSSNVRSKSLPNLLRRSSLMLDDAKMKTHAVIFSFIEKKIR